jgi:hypothetical protein
VNEADGPYYHQDGLKQGAVSCGQGEDFWIQWNTGKFGDVSLSDGVIEYSKPHEEIKGAFLTFQKDVVQIYPGWAVCQPASQLGVMTPVGFLIQRWRHWLYPRPGNVWTYALESRLCIRPTVPSVRGSPAQWPHPVQNEWLRGRRVPLHV